MLCPNCGATSAEVVETRAWRGLYLRRRRRCTRGHLFTTYEVTDDQLRPLEPTVPSLTERRRMQEHLRGRERAAYYDQLRDAIIKTPPHVSARLLAESLRCSVTFIHKCRNDAFPKKVRQHP